MRLFFNIKLPNMYYSDNQPDYWEVESEQEFKNPANKGPRFMNNSINSPLPQSEEMYKQNLPEVLQKKIRISERS